MPGRGCWDRGTALRPWSAFSSLGHEAERRDERGAQRRTAEFAGTATIRAVHRVGGVLIVAHREPRNENVEMCCVLDVPAGWILRGFGDGLANRSLQFIRIGLRLYSVKVQIHASAVQHNQNSEGK